MYDICLDKAINMPIYYNYVNHYFVSKNIVKGAGLIDEYKMKISEEYKKEPAPQLYQVRRYNKSAPRNIINK